MCSILFCPLLRIPDRNFLLLPAFYHICRLKMCCTRLSNAINFLTDFTFPDFSLSFDLSPFSCSLNWFNFLSWKKFSSMSGARSVIHEKSYKGWRTGWSFCKNVFHKYCHMYFSVFLVIHEKSHKGWRTIRSFFFAKDVFLKYCQMYFCDSGYSWKVSQRMEDSSAIGGSFCLECSYTCGNIYMETGICV